MSYAELSPNAAALLAWLVARGGSALQRDFGDTAPRAFRKAGIYGPLVDELLTAGAIVETRTRPRTFEVVRASAPKSSSGSKLLDMLADATAELDDVPVELAAYWGAVSTRDRLVANMRVRNGLPSECECCSKAGAAVDRAVVEAFDCEMPD